MAEVSEKEIERQLDTVKALLLDATIASPKGMVETTHHVVKQVDPKPSCKTKCGMSIRHAIFSAR